MFLKNVSVPVTVTVFKNKKYSSGLNPVLKCLLPKKLLDMNNSQHVILITTIMTTQDCLMFSFVILYFCCLNTFQKLYLTATNFSKSRRKRTMFQNAVHNNESYESHSEMPFHFVCVAHFYAFSFLIFYLKDELCFSSGYRKSKMKRTNKKRF